MKRTILVLSLCAVQPACSSAPPGTETIGTSSQPLCGDRRARASAFASLQDLPHGVAGDRDLVFIAEPLAGRVLALDRATSQPVGELPPPAGGWLLPFAVRVPQEGHLVVLDSGGFPDPSTPSIPRVLDYTYSANGQPRALEATLARTVSFAGLPLVFAEDVEALTTGDYVVSESVIGGLWVVHPDGSITAGIVPSSLAPGAGVPQLGPCSFPGVVIEGIPFRTQGDFAPGVVALASSDEQLYFGTTCQGGVYRVPIASLTDPSRPPPERAADIVAVSPRPAGTLETFEGLAFDRHGGGGTLFAADSFHGRVLRIDPLTGAREVVVEDPALLDFPVSLQVLPARHGPRALVVASDQEYRLPSINAAISAPLVHLPFVVAEVAR
jgi:hypothetical protein